MSSIVCLEHEDIATIALFTIIFSFFAASSRCDICWAIWIFTARFLSDGLRSIVVSSGVAQVIGLGDELLFAIQSQVETFSWLA